MPNPLSWVGRAVSRFTRYAYRTGGNVAVLTALITPILVLAAGAATDYIAATRREETLNGIADAAALAAVTPQQMSQTAAQARIASLALFNSQAATVTGVGTVTPTITVTDGVTANNNLVRTAQVTYTSTSNNVFIQILGMSTIALGGGATAKNTLAPHINFHMLLDTSPSMAIGATPADILTLENNTTNQGTPKCGFACHETDPNADVDDQLYNPASVKCTSTPPMLPNGTADPTGYPAGSTQFPKVGTHNSIAYGAEDNFALARCLGVTLRIDNVNTAIQDMVPLAQVTQAQYLTGYNIDFYTMDAAFNQLSIPSNSPVCNIAAGTTSVGSAAPSCPTSTTTALPNLSQLAIYNNGGSDEDSYLDNGIEQMYSILTSNGTVQGGIGTPTNPQQVLIIVSDAVPDWAHPPPSGPRLPFTVINTPKNPATGNDYCTDIKNAKIRIAFLYLTYYPLPTNGYYNSNIAPLQGTTGGAAYNTANDQFYQAAQNCATPGLFAAVSVGGDVPAALKALFVKAAQTAYLSQ